MEDSKSFLRLREIVDIINGKAIEKNPVQDGDESMGIITGANLGLHENGMKWGLDLAGVWSFRKDRPYYPNEVKLYDILLTGRGTELHIARFSEDDEAKRKVPIYIADKNLFILRVKGEAGRQKKISKILALFLSSEQGKGKLKSSSRNTSKIQLSKEDVGNIEIPALSSEEQEALLKQYKHTWKDFSQALKAFEDKKMSFRCQLTSIENTMFADIV